MTARENQGRTARENRGEVRRRGIHRCGWWNGGAGRSPRNDLGNLRPDVRSDVRQNALERAAVDIPVVTTMVSGYGEAVDVLVGRGRWAAASRALRAELAAYEQRKYRPDAARTSIALGRLHLAMGEVGPAARCFDRALELASMCPEDAESGGADHGSADHGSADHGDADHGNADHGNARLIGEALRWSGVAALDEADLERSERLLRSALVAIGPEADPHQVFAIELSLARCLFWQGRVREVVLPSIDVPTVIVGASISNHHDSLATVILRVERWRRAARIALVDRRPFGRGRRNRASMPHRAWRR